MELEVTAAMLAPLVQLAQFTKAKILVLTVVTDTEILSENATSSLQSLLNGINYSTHNY